MDLKGIYTADANRYTDAEALYKRCGKSGVLLPKISLGFWDNFGGVDPSERSRAITHYAFDHGITHFDLANNYGPPYGSAEETMGRLMQDDFRPYRDELFIATKAGYDMWEGPYGNWGSRKYLMRLSTAHLSGQTQHARPCTTGEWNPRLLPREWHRFHLLLTFSTRSPHRPLSQRNPIG